MGLILGRFRKKKTTLEQLEKLDADINSIEEFRLNTELAQRKIVGHFIVVSAVVYIIVAVVFYFYFFPATFYDQLFYITPLLLVPFIIWGVKRLLTWYYRRKITRNENKLSVLRTEKKKLLEQVMDTETYKVAKTILEKFAPDQLRKSPPSFEISSFKGLPMSTPSGVRSRNTMVKAVPPKTPSMGLKALPAAESFTPGLKLRQSSNGGQSTGALSLVRTPGLSSTLPLPREILPRDRSVLDKMVEYLVGDGPSNRFALICKNCHSHNGMALREEFEYVAFRCCYCYTFNPARKLRPQAPKLEFDLPSPPSLRRGSEHSTSSSEKNSGTDSEDSDQKVASRRNSEAEAPVLGAPEAEAEAETGTELEAEDKTASEKKTD